jgi:hypothetical protein
LGGDEGGDWLVIKFLKAAREEEVVEVVRPMMGNNQPVGSQRASKMVSEVRERRLCGQKEEVLAEEPLDGHRWRVIRMVRQVEEAQRFSCSHHFLSNVGRSR